jgi:hypothetical protein
VVEKRMQITDPNKNGLGRIEVRTLALPEFVRDLSAAYTYSGKVLIHFRKPGDSDDPDYQNIAVVNDDGGCFREIFSGVIRQHKKANGIRYMCFADNKRVLLGDYVLECSPDIDTAESVRLVPVEYPWNIEEDPLITRHWSEIIIAPDNEHIAWTMLRSDIGAASAIGKLSRLEDRYQVINARIISTVEVMKQDPAQPGWLIPQVVRGGELKQFVHGGTAISLVGAKEGAGTNSVIQDLASEDLTQITFTPGYDETTIFSPDERLGIVMSTRFSPKTDPAVFGLLSRPGGMVAQGITMHLYMYAVAGVRAFRKGNIGPALIEIDRSMNEKNYLGVALNDPDEAWVYYSPMSWHPGGKKVMWPEGLRGKPDRRIRIAELLDYTPGPAIPVRKTPEVITYTEQYTQDISNLRGVGHNAIKGKIAGKHSGHIEYKQQGAAMGGSVEAVYVDYSDDGKRFYRGYEKARYSVIDVSVYEADLELEGEETGEMKLRVSFSELVGGPPKLLFEKAEDGKPKSYGHASYRGITLRVEDLVE